MKRLLFPLFSLAGWLAGITALEAAPALTAGAARGTPGGPLTVPVSLTGAPVPTALQFDLRYDPALLRAGAVTPVAALAGRTVFAAVVGPGTNRVVIFSSNNIPLPAGPLVNAAFEVTRAAGNGSTPVSFGEILAVDAAAANVAFTASTPGAVTITGAPDRARPSLAITPPKAGARGTNPVVRLEGTAKDNNGVKAVYYSLNGGPYQTAAGTTNWFAFLAPAAGPNTLRVQAADFAGNTSAPVARAFTLVVTQSLNLIVSGPGRVAGVTNRQPLELGKVYKVTATPSNGAAFHHWGGATNARAAALNFVMVSNATLLAAFVPNPYPGFVGAYNGLFHPPAGPQPTNSGFFSFNVSAKGAASGKLLLNGATHSLNGLAFDLDGHAATTLKRSGKPALLTDWQLDAANGEISGTISDGTFTVPLAGDRAGGLAEWQGGYTFLITGAENPTNSPGGDGSGLVTVDAKGAAKFSGSLGDGTPVSQTVPLSRGGRAPLYQSLAKGGGLLLGWAQFHSNGVPAHLLVPELWWLKPAAARDKFYPAGFTVEAALLGARRQHAALLNWTNGRVRLTGGNLPAPLAHNVRFVGGKLVPADDNPNQVKAALGADGRYSGTFLHPLTRKTVAFKGAILQFAPVDFGGSAFNGTNHTGRASLQADVDSFEQEE